MTYTAAQAVALSASALSITAGAVAFGLGVNDAVTEQPAIGQTNCKNDPAYQGTTVAMACVSAGGAVVAAIMAGDALVKANLMV